MRLPVSLTWSISFALLSCAELTEPGPGAPALQKEPAGDSEPAPAPSDAPARAAPAAPAVVERITASHVLIAFEGSAGSAAAKRSKEEARKLANEVLAKAKAGEDFAALATKYSDDPTAKRGGGGLGSFTRDRMVKPFSDAAFALKPGEVSSVVETNFGFHVIKRTE